MMYSCPKKSKHKEIAKKKERQERESKKQKKSKILKK